MICVIFRCLLAVNKDLIWTYHNPNCPMRLSLISDSDCLCRIRGGSWFVACTGIMVCVERSLLRIWNFFWMFDAYLERKKKNRVFDALMMRVGEGWLWDNAATNESTDCDTWVHPLARSDAWRLELGKQWRHPFTLPPAPPEKWMPAELSSPAAKSQNFLVRSRGTWQHLHQPIVTLTDRGIKPELVSCLFFPLMQLWGPEDKYDRDRQTHPVI